jgi:predicted nucleic acid-binding protein
VTYVLDTGALVALERGDRETWGLLATAWRETAPVWTSAAATAQAWRGGARQSRLARALAGIREHDLTASDARRIGALLATTATTDVVDAHVASLAADGDVVVTSDPRDLRALLEARAVSAAVALA